jgi:hypothetical protein
MNIGPERPDEPDIQALIRQLAATWSDPGYVAGAILIEQDALRAAEPRKSADVIQLAGRQDFGRE